MSRPASKGISWDSLWTFCTVRICCQREHNFCSAYAMNGDPLTPHRKEIMRSSGYNPETWQQQIPEPQPKPWCMQQMEPRPIPLHEPAQKPVRSDHWSCNQIGRVFFPAASAWLVFRHSNPRLRITILPPGAANNRKFATICEIGQRAFLCFLAKPMPCRSDSVDSRTWNSRPDGQKRATEEGAEFTK